MRYVVAAATIFIIIILGFLLFGHRTTKTPSVAKFLADYANSDVEMQLTTSGEINAQELHREIVINIGQNQRTVSVVQGYQGNVIKSESFPNSESAYKAFLSAVDLAGYTRTKTSRFPTEAGQCPLGQRFVYQILNDSKANQRTWSTTCGSVGTFAGNGTLIRQLFQNQIGNYQEFVRDVRL
jgi:hypothetical protein